MKHPIPSPSSKQRPDETINEFITRLTADAAPKALAPSLDAELACTRRDLALEAVEDNAAPDFIDVATDLIHEFLLDHEELFCDNFLAFAEGRLPHTHTLKALGAAYQRAARKGWMKKKTIPGTSSFEFRPSNTANRSPKVVWASLIFAPPTTLF